MDTLQVRRAWGAIAIAKQCVDVFTGIDVTPARSVLLCECLELLPVAAHALLAVAGPAWMLKCGVPRRVVGEAKNVLQQRLQAMVRVALVEGCRVFAFKELLQREAQDFLPQLVSD